MNTLINPNSSIPMYKQAIQFINELISKKNLQPGMKIPSEAELVKSLGVSRITIRSAITEMVEEGLLTRSQGKGTFVSLPHKKILLMQMTVLDSLNLVKWQEKKRLLKF